MSKTNIQVDYLYRDEGNYKSWAYPVFTNKSNMSIGDVWAGIQKSLFDECFNPLDVGLLSLRTDSGSADCGHDLHEVEAVNHTNLKETTGVDIADFIKKLAEAFPAGAIRAEHLRGTARLAGRGLLLKSASFDTSLNGVIPANYAEVLAEKEDFSPGAAKTLIKLVNDYGSSMLANAHALALAMGKEDGDLGH